MSKDLAFNENANIAWDLHEANENVPLAFTEENNVELFGIEPAKAKEMVGGLDSTLADREVLKNAYIDVIELDITSENLATFKELRLKLVKNRTSIETWHKNNKAFYLAGGRFVDAIKNKEIEVNKEMESKLLEGEKFFENQEKEKARLLNEERIEKVRPYVEDITGLDFTPMNDEDFDDYVLGKKTRFENEAKTKKEAEEKEAEDKRLNELAHERQMQIAPYAQFLNSDVLLREMSDDDYKELFFDLQNAKIEFDKDQEKIRLENERLKKEAEAKEKALEKERAEAKAKQDAIELKAKQEREKAESERKIEADKKDAEIKRLNEEKEKYENERIAKEKAQKLEAEKLAKAPVKKQLSVWVESFELPNTEVENELSKEIKDKFEAFKKWSLTQINNL